MESIQSPGEAAAMCHRNNLDILASISGLISGPAVWSTAMAARIASACCQLRDVVTIGAPPQETALKASPVVLFRPLAMADE